MTDEELNWQIAEHKAGIQRSEFHYRPDDYLHDDGAAWRALMELPNRVLYRARGVTVVSFVQDGQEPWLNAVEHADAAHAVWAAWCTWRDLQQGAGT